MKTHPAAELFPMLAKDRLQELADDISAHGLKEPITLCDGMILDGRNRFAACEIAGVEPKYREFSGGDPFAWVWSLNGQRRDLTQDQRAAIWLEVNEQSAEWIAKQAAAKEEANRKRSQAAKGNDNASKDRENSAATSCGATVSDDKRSAKTEEAAKASNTNRGAIERQQRLRRERPDLAEKVRSGELKPSHAMRELRMADIDRQREQIASGLVALPEGVFEVISIDPPWPYDDGKSQSPYDPHGHRASNPYPEMTLDEIASIQLPAADDCVLWFWTTHKFMRHAFPILDRWGFQERAIVSWVKDRMGLGRWLRSQSEFCIMATRGNPTISLTNQTTVLKGPMREHSRKPDEFYEMVESLCVGRKLDYFSREARDGWAQLGNEPEKFARAVG